MKLYFSSRQAARNSLKAHKLVDAGADAPQGKRYSRDISAYAKANKEAKDLVQAYMHLANDMFEDALV